MVALFPILMSPNRTQFRACELCTFGTQSLEGHFCERTGEAVQLARSDAGACGPNARHLLTDFALS